MSFNSVEEILRNIIQWEKDFDLYYETLADYLKDPSARDVIEILKKRHGKVLEELQSIDPKKYARIEFVKFVPRYHGDDNFAISADSSAEEIFYKILEHEETRIEYYNRLRNISVFDKSKELFDILIQLKTRQVKDIKALLDSCHFV